MRYYKKCRDCNGQGKLAKRGSNYHLSISCTCEGGFVDCTSEVEAMRDFIEQLAAYDWDEGYPNYGDDFSSFYERAKKLLESMKG